MRIKKAKLELIASNLLLIAIFLSNQFATIKFLLAAIPVIIIELLRRYGLFDLLFFFLCAFVFAFLSGSLGSVAIPVELT